MRNIHPAFWTVLSGAVGAGLGVGLVAHYGLGAVIGLLVRSRFGILTMVALHCFQLWLTAQGWCRLLSQARNPPGARWLFVVRWVREGISTLLPLTPVGGVMVGIRLLCRKGMQAVTASAATVVDLSLELLTQIAFALLGLAFLARLLAPAAVAIPILVGLVVLIAMATAFAAAQWLGLARVAERMAERLGMAGRVDGLHEAIIGVYRARTGLASSALFHLLAWLTGTFEVWLAMHFLGRNVDLPESVAIESLGQMLRTASFAIPAALGVQEGGYVLLCGLFGIGPDLALALSLMKRLREILIGIPSVALWLRLERQPPLPRTNELIFGSKSRAAGRD